MATTRSLDLDPFVIMQLKFCEAQHYQDLFQGFGEERFRSLSLAELDKLPIDVETRERILEHVFSLRYEQKKQQLELDNTTTTTTAASLVQVKQDPSFAEAPEEAFIADEGEIEVTFCNLVSATPRSTTSRLEPQGNVNNGTLLQNSQGVLETMDLADPQGQNGTSDGLSVKSELSEDSSDTVLNRYAHSNVEPVTPAAAEQQGSASQVGNTFNLFLPKQIPFTGTHCQFDSVRTDVNEEETSKQKTESNASYATEKIPKMFWNNLISELPLPIPLPERETTKDKRPWRPTSQQMPKLHDFASLEQLTLSSRTLKTQIGIRYLKNVMSKKLQMELQKMNCKNVKVADLLKLILSVATHLESIKFLFMDPEDVVFFLDTLHEIPQKSLKKLELVSQSDDIHLIEDHVSKLATLAEALRYLGRLEVLILNSKVERCHDRSLDLLLYRLAGSLKQFTVTKNFVGKGIQSETFQINIPLMQKLETLELVPEYRIRGPKVSAEPEEATVVDLEADNNQMEHQHQIHAIQVFVTFNNNNDYTYNNMNIIRFGSLFDVNLDIMNLPMLDTFQVGGNWNLQSITNKYLDNAHMPSQCLSLRSLQFPDGIADPALIEQVRSFCPNLKKVKLQLPTLHCLQAFFKAFRNSGVTKLDLTFDYDFQLQLTSAFCGKPYDLSSLPFVPQLGDMLKLQKLKECPGWESFVKRHHIKPIGNPEPNSSSMHVEFFGISALTNLKKLKVTYKSKCLKFPKNPQNVSAKKRFSYKRFPIDREIYQELSKLKLDSMHFYTTSIPKLAEKARRELYRKNGWELTQGDRRIPPVTVPIPRKRKISDIEGEEEGLGETVDISSNIIYSRTPSKIKTEA